MNPTRIGSAPPVPTGTRAAVRSICVRSTLWVLGPLAVAVPVSVALAFAGADGDWFGAVWVAVLFWTIGATFVQALWQGLRHGDWAAFTYCDWPSTDDDFDFETRSGEFAYLRIRAEHEALVREDDRVLEDHDHGDSRT